MPRQKFESGYVADTGTLENDQRIDNRSFMDKGESVFANDAGRENVAQGVRNTLLAKMRDINAKSLTNADAMAREHTSFEERQMLPLIATAKKKVRDSNIAYAEYLVAKSRESSESALSVRQEMQQLLTNGSLMTGQGAAVENPIQNNQENQIIENRQQMQNQEDNESVDSSSDEHDISVSNDGSEDGGNGQENNQGNNPGNNAENQPENANLANPGNGAEVIQEDTELRNQDIQRLQRLSNEINANAGRNRWAVTKLVTFVGKKKRNAERKKNQAIAEAQAMGDQIRQAAVRWDNIRKNHRRGSFRQLYRQYDNLAMKYYAFSRGVNADDRRLGEFIANGGGNAAKRIAEYTGVFDLDQLNTLITDAINRPYTPPPRLRHKMYKETNAGSLNETDTGRNIKYHKAITVAGFADGITNKVDEKEAGNPIARRYKLLSDFKGYEAKRQFTNNRQTAVNDTGRTADERGKTAARNNEGREASQMNLKIDEKGTNGAYLFSEKSAKIYEAKTKGFFRKETVHGFYMGNEFISDDYSMIQSNEQVGSIKGTNLEDAALEESLRLAIRRSDFFRHVNAATIQYYSSYQANDIANPDDIKTRIKHRVRGQNGQQQADDAHDNADEQEQNNQPQNEQAGGPQGENQNNPVVQQDQAAINAAWEAQPASYKLMQLIDAVMDPNSQQAQVLNAGNDDNTKGRIRTIFRDMLAEDTKREASREILMIMLSEENTSLWDMAREFAISMGGRFKTRVNRLPDAGELMRIGLLEEVANDRKFDLSDIGGSLLPTSLQMHKEDLKAKRDGFFSFTNIRQSFWDGSLLSPITGTFSAVTGDLKSYKYNGDIRYACNTFNKNYAEVAESASTNFGLVLAPIPAIVGITTGGTIKGLDDEGEAEINEKAENSLSAVGTLYSAVEFIENVYSLVKKVQDLIKKGSDKKALLLDCLKLLVEILTNIVDIIYWWLDKPFIKTALSALGFIKNALDLVKDAITIYRTSKEINKIKASDEDINTAMTEYQEWKRLHQGNEEVSENNMQSKAQKMGLANSKNSQGQYFLALAKSRARRQRKMAWFDAGKNVVSGTGNFIKWFALPVSFAFKTAAKVISFIGWCVGKSHDNTHFTENIANMLGNKQYADYPNFSSVLKRETGIKNKHYLVDLARIFMAIDTHHFVTKPDKTEGETALVISLMQPYLKLTGGDNENKEKLKGVEFGKLLSAVGGPGNWRAVLRASIQGE
ncbi:MAG: hypothetical protein E7302_13795 [Butyrivibrio sp.]|nr:hypothetical protein [Butyrivibrio sp.]